ncbi:hypothetical protein Si099_02096 [Streptococcus infantarius subsp. infantarius]|nr:hypothetical protein [Streptococcus infantarius subsp. infantarius]
MNKQEAIERVNELTITVALKGSGTQVLIDQQAVLEVIDQINEPEKPVVPEFVADMIAERKNQKYGIVETIQNLNVFNNPFDYIIENQFKWVIENQEDFVKAWLYGYEVEHEQQYVVAIPDDGRNGFIQLWKSREGKLLFNFSDKIRYGKVHLLTEQEIKQKDERLWQFAKEVEDD